MAERRALPTKPAIICGVPAAYGGLSSARKYSRVDLGSHAVCNRRVTVNGQVCFQHRDRYEFGLAYGSNMGGDEVSPGIWVEVTSEWDPEGGGSHISEAGTFYRREVGTTTWERICGNNRPEES